MHIISGDRCKFTNAGVRALLMIVMIHDSVTVMVDWVPYAVWVLCVYALIQIEMKRSWILCDFERNTPNECVFDPFIMPPECNAYTLHIYLYKYIAMAFTCEGHGAPHQHGHIILRVMTLQSDCLPACLPCLARAHNNAFAKLFAHARANRSFIWRADGFRKLFFDLCLCAIFFANTLNGTGSHWLEPSQRARKKKRRQFGCCTSCVCFHLIFKSICCASITKCAPVTMHWPRMRRDTAQHQTILYMDRSRPAYRIHSANMSGVLFCINRQEIKQRKESIEICTETNNNVKYYYFESVAEETNFFSRTG